MIKKLELTGIHYDIDENTHKYALAKLGKLDKYMPRHARVSASAEVKLRQVNKDHGNKYEAEMILVLPDKTLVAKDSTVNMLAAIDIIEAKMIAQLGSYKTTSHPF
jgi:putative sigma-54 modulation protein